MNGISIGDQGHPTALFLLEVLLNHQGPIPIATLYLSVQAYYNNNGFIDPYSMAVPINSSSFTEFIEFLQRFPSLFVLAGNYVYPAGLFEIENQPHVFQPKFSYIDTMYACPTQSTNQSAVPYLFDPSLRRNTVGFLQNYLMTCGSHRYIPLQRLFGCLSYISLPVRSALPTLKALLSFLRQYPEIFHLKDGMVGLTKLKRPIRPSMQTENSDETVNTTTEELSEMSSDALTVEVLLSKSNDFSKSSPFKLPISDFSVILVLRRILRPAGTKGFHVALAIKQLIQFPYNLHKIVGLTRFEIHAFIEKYKTFFDILPMESLLNGEQNIENGKLPYRIPNSFCVRINAEAWHMRSRILDSRAVYANGKDQSKLDQHIGRVFRVAKSWGIIDLGNHIHVFFDKSIFRNVSDLQKIFQPNELVYFDAIRAPLRSRAKWRATRVWKTDDHDLLRHVQTSSLTLHNGDNSGGCGRVTTPCLPFLIPSSCHQTASTALRSHKVSVESMPAEIFGSSGGSSTSKAPLRRCQSLEKQRLSEERTTVHRRAIADIFDDDEEFTVDTFYMSDDELANTNGDRRLLLPHYDDEELLFAFDALKRPIKLLHNTGGVLADLEFPDSDVSWTPDHDQMSAASPAISRSTANNSNKNHHNSTCNASTQTWFTGCVTSAEVYHGPTCTHEQTTVE